MPLQHVVLHLNVSFDITDVPFGITLSLLVIFLDLPLVPVLYPLLECLDLLLPVLLDPLQLHLQVACPVPFSVQQRLILSVGVLKVLELSKVLSQ